MANDIRTYVKEVSERCQEPSSAFDLWRVATTKYIIRTDMHTVTTAVAVVWYLKRSAKHQPASPCPGQRAGPVCIRCVAEGTTKLGDDSCTP